MGLFDLTTAATGGIVNALDGQRKRQMEDEQRRRQQQADEEARQQRQLEQAERQYKGLSGIASQMTERGNYQGAAGLAPQVARSANTAYGSSLPTNSIVGSPRMGAPNDFTGPGTVRAIGSAGIPMPAAKFGQRDPYKEMYNEATGEVIRPAQANPYKTLAEDTQARWDADRLARMNIAASTQQAIGAANQRQAMGIDASRERTQMGIDGRATQASNKDALKRMAASGLVAQAVAQQFPWVDIQGVSQSTGDITLNIPQVLSERERRRLRDAGAGVYTLFEEPGKPAKLIVTGTPDASLLRAKAKPQTAGRGAKLIEDKRTGTLVEAKPGTVVRDVTEKWTPALDDRARKRALAMVTAEHGGFLPTNAGPEIEDAYQMLRGQWTGMLNRGQPIGNGEDGFSGAPATATPPKKSALDRLIEMQESKKKGRP